jgi:hypothetical protein
MWQICWRYVLDDETVWMFEYLIYVRSDVYGATSGIVPYTRLVT